MQYSTKNLRVVSEPDEFANLVDILEMQCNTTGTSTQTTMQTLKHPCYVIHFHAIYPDQISFKHHLHPSNSDTPIPL